jgi:hypothetical protein
MKLNVGFEQMLEALQLSEFDFGAILQKLDDFSDITDEDVIVVDLDDAEIEQEINEIVNSHGFSPHKTGAFGVSTMSKEEAMAMSSISGDDGLYKRIHDVLSGGKQAIVWHRKKVTVVQGVPWK